MIELKKMTRADVPALFDMALRAFQPDFERYGVYPPLLKMDKKRFLPPIVFGRIILADNVMIGGVFAMGMGRKGELGAIFIDPVRQKKGYGRLVMQAVEKAYPKVRRWKLDTPGGNLHLHRFYESLGYVKTGERKDPRSGMVAFIYEKEVI